MNKHKKFIKDAYEGKYGTMCQDWKDTILRYYPEFRKQEFKVGDWVFFSPENKLNRIIGYDRMGDYKTERITGETSYWCKKDAGRKATKEEIEQHLIKEAERRGYKKGASIISLGECWESKHCKGQKSTISKKINHNYDYDIDLLWVDVLEFDGVSDNAIIYEKGKWAEIIDTMTKEEAEKKLGCKII